MTLFRLFLNPFAQLICYIMARIPFFMNIFRSHTFWGKRFIARFLTDKNFPPKGQYLCGDFFFDLDFSDIIQRDIYLNLSENDGLKIVKKYVGKGATCLDIGANIGIYSLYIANILGDEGKQYCFEPDPANFRRLEQNIKINHLEKNTTMYQKGVSATTGKSVFSICAQENSGLGRIGEWGGAVDTIQINMVSIDEFLASKNIDHVDFTKIDVEGHEIEVIEGAKKALTNKTLKFILVEYGGFVLERDGWNLNRFIQLFLAFDYTPTDLNMKKVNQALQGSYVSRGEVFNLFFRA